MMIRLWAARIVGFAFCCALAVALEALLVYALGGMFHRQMMPRGAGWVAIPIMAGVVGAGVFSSAIDKFAEESSREIRLATVAIGSWIALALLYMFLAEPYGTYMSHEEYVSAAEWVLIPTLAGIIIWRCARWAMQGR